MRKLYIEISLISVDKVFLLFRIGSNGKYFAMKSYRLMLFVSLKAILFNIYIKFLSTVGEEKIEKEQGW